MSASSAYEALVNSILTREYAKAFQRATGLSVELVPSDQLAPLFSFQRKENPFCSLMAQFTGSCIACQQAHAEMQQRLVEKFAPQLICCFAGLTEFAVPIRVGGQHVATLLGGQVFQRKPTQAQFTRLVRQLRTWGMHRELQRVKRAYFQTQVIARKQIQASMQMLTIFTSFLAEDVNRDLLTAGAHDQPCITTAKNFILAHASEPLRLRDVAEQVHVSANYFSKFFKKTTGIGFSEFLGRVRVENAKALLADPVLHITEVASQTGFGSLSQFNRAFQRFAGCSPKAYRAARRQDHSP